MSLNGKIDDLSNLVVNKYVEEGVPLNETIVKIAESERFGESHIARLVEMSNKKTFLKVFPEKHSFDVASVPAVMERMGKEKKACRDGLETCLHSETGLKPVSTTANEMNYKLLTLYKSAHSHEPSAMSHGTSALLASQTKIAIDELAFESRRKMAEMLDCEDRLVDITKQAVLRGSSFADLETYTLSTLDGKQKEASEVLDRVHRRVKDMPFVEKRASERGVRVEPFIGESNIYTDTVEKIIKNAEDIPVIERAILSLRGPSPRQSGS